jgi:hypothetical protein
MALFRHRRQADCRDVRNAESALKAAPAPTQEKTLRVVRGGQDLQIAVPHNEVYVG